MLKSLRVGVAAEAIWKTGEFLVPSSQLLPQHPFRGVPEIVPVKLQGIEDCDA